MLITILGVVLFATLVGTIAGFGIGTILLPTLLVFYPFEQALTLVGITHLVANLGRIALFKKGINVRLALLFGIPAITLTFIGASLVESVPKHYLKVALGIFLIVYSAKALLHKSMKIKANTHTALLGGSLAGFVAGIIGTGGTIRGAFLSAFNLKKSMYLATTAVLSLAVDFTRVPVYLYNNYLTDFSIVPYLIVTALAGTYLGKKLATKISEKKYKTILYCILLLAGVKILMSAF